MPTGLFSIESWPQFALALSCVAVTLAAAVRYPNLVVAAVLGVVLAEQSIFFSFDNLTRDDPVPAYATDVIAVSVGAIGVARLVRLRVPSVPVAAAAVLAVLVAVGVLSWSLELAPVMAKTWRYWLAMAALGLWGVTSPTGWTKRTANIFVGFGVVVALTQVAGFLVYGFHGYGATFQSGDVVRTTRPVSAYLALGMTVAVCVLWRSRPRWTVWQVLLGSFLLLSTLLSQHRSVWAATLAALVVLVGWDWLDRDNRRRAVRTTWVGAAVMAATVLVAFTRTPLESAVANRGTLSWRMDGWSTSFTVERSLFEWLFGGAFGPTTFFAAPQQRPEALMPATHSTYVGAIHIVGVVGLIVLLVFLLGPILKGSRKAVHPSVSWAVTAALLVYGVLYLPTIWSMLLVGLLCARPRAIERVRLDGLPLASATQYAPSRRSTAPTVLTRINRSSVRDQFST